MVSERNALKIVMVLLVVTILLVIGTIILSVKTRSTDPSLVPNNIKQKMIYHGVQVLYEDWKGNLYFYRNGERIRV